MHVKHGWTKAFRMTAAIVLCVGPWLPGCATAASSDSAALTFVSIPAAPTAAAYGIHTWRAYFGRTSTVVSGFDVAGNAVMGAQLAAFPASGGLPAHVRFMVLGASNPTLRVFYETVAADTVALARVKALASNTTCPSCPVPDDGSDINVDPYSGAVTLLRAGAAPAGPTSTANDPAAIAGYSSAASGGTPGATRTQDVAQPALESVHVEGSPGIDPIGSESRLGGFASVAAMFQTTATDMTQSQTIMTQMQADGEKLQMSPEAVSSSVRQEVDDIANDVGQYASSSPSGSYAMAEYSQHDRRGRRRPLSVATDESGTIRFAWREAAGLAPPADLSVELAGKEVLQVAAVNCQAFARLGLSVVPIRTGVPYQLRLDRSEATLHVRLTEDAAEGAGPPGARSGNALVDVQIVAGVREGSASVVLANAPWRQAIDLNP